MERYKIGKKKIKIALPSGWHEVPFNKGLKIMEGGLSDIEVLALLADVDKKEIEETTDKHTIAYFTSSFLFLKRMPKNLENPEMPNSINLDGKTISFPYVLYDDKFDLGKCSMGQVNDMKVVLINKYKEYIGDEDRGFTQLEIVRICLILSSIYIQKLIDKDYDYDKALKLTKEIGEQLSFKEVTNIGSFFLERLTDLINGLQKTYQNSNSIQRKLRLAFSKSMQYLVSILPLKR